MDSEKKNNIVSLVSHVGYLAVCAQVGAVSGNMSSEDVRRHPGDRKLSCDVDHFSTQFTAWWTAQAVNIVVRLILRVLSFCAALPSEATLSVSRSRVSSPRLFRT